MKILFINHYAGSSFYGMDYRQYYLAKEWVRAGHDVTIIGADFSHVRIHQPAVLKDLQLEWIEGIRYLWIKTPRYLSSGLRRIVNIFTFVVKVLIYSAKISGKYSPEVVIVSSTYVLDVYPAWFIAKRLKARLIYELHDLWPLTPMVIGGYSKYHPFIRMVQRAENFACRNCDHFVSVLGNAREYLVRHGMDPAKFTHIPNGYTPHDISIVDDSIPEEHEQLFQRLVSQARVIVGYAGGHSPSNALASLIYASKSIPDELPVAFVLIGDGSQKNELINLAARQNCDNIFFLPPVPKASIPALLDRCDLLYAGGVSSVLHSYGTSFTKVIDYMLAGKPVIFAVDDPDSLVAKVGCGLQVPAENADEIARAIEYFCGLSPVEREVIGRKGKEYAEKELCYSSLAKKFIEVIHVD